MLIDPSISTEQGVFVPEVVALMCEAFDAACRDLSISDQSRGVRELIATLIIGAATRGVFDPFLLRIIARSGVLALTKTPPPVPLAPSRRAC